MMSVEELLLDTLENLGTEKLKRFKWRLEKNSESISNSHLKSADAPDTVDIMVARFTPEGAVKITLNVLRKMNENHLAEKLENKYKDVGNAVQMSSDTHTVDLNLQSGETGNAPVLTRNIMPNPVSANFSSSSGGVGLEQYNCRTQKKVDPVVNFPSSGLEGLSKNGQDLKITTLRQQYACYLTLDPNTAHPNLFLSERNRRATHTREKQPYPDHPERFKRFDQVLCQESLTGRCYWEVEMDGQGTEIAVTYKRMGSQGVNKDYLFGRNAWSWNLSYAYFGYSLWHNTDMTVIRVCSLTPNRVGVYVDVSAGTLSYYSISDTHTLTHLHTFNTTFTEPLYAGFLVRSGCSVSLCEI